MNTVIHWFRRDLRLHDNTALNAALESGARVIPLFIFDRRIYAGSRAAGARTSFLLEGLKKLDDALRKQGSGLLIRHGEPAIVLQQLLEAASADKIFFNRDYSPYARQRDRQIHDLFGAERVHAAHDLLLHPPTTVMTNAGSPYTVFTPFKRAWLSKTKQPPHTAGGRFHNLEDIDSAVLPALADLSATCTIELPEAGEAAALRRLERFAEHTLSSYDAGRDYVYAQPWLEKPQGTSALSPYLRLGFLSVRQAYAAAVSAESATISPAARESIATWISELAWRDFYTHILYHFPQVVARSFREEYDRVEWRDASDEYDAWVAGMTGYPIVDAAMRQLQQTGWMHNRARMIVASFLTKDLLHDWRRGEAHFMRHLLDGDPAANNGGWQWSAGTGTDAQPYFRIFNPVSQSQKCDPEGMYIRHFIPELRDVPTEYIHAPWMMPSPPSRYPRPIVDHAHARERALAAFKLVRQQSERS